MKKRKLFEVEIINVQYKRTNKGRCIEIIPATYKVKRNRKLEKALDIGK